MGGKAKRAYKRGRYREYKVRDFLRKLGLFVVRCAGSKPVDLVIVRNGESIFCEVKSEPYLAPSERKKLEEIARASGSPVYLAVWAKGKLTLYHVAGPKNEQFEALLAKAGVRTMENFK